MNLLLFLILCAIGLSTVASSNCEPCVYGPDTYSCGVVLNSTGVLEMCWNAVWYLCSQNADGQPVCNHPPAHHPTRFINYTQTPDGVIYSNYVQTVDYIDGYYHMADIVHSSQLKEGDKVLWPHCNDVNFMIILTIDHHDVTTDKDNCCRLRKNGTKCEQMFCCGHHCY